MPVGIHLVRVPFGSALFRDVYELEVETVRDMPGEEGVVMPAVRGVAGGACRRGRGRRARRAGRRRAGRDGHPVVSAEQPGVVWHWMTAIRSSHRRRGLGGAIKHASLLAAAEHGATTSRTFNEARNDGMRRINEGFVYRGCPTS